MDVKVQLFHSSNTNTMKALMKTIEQKMKSSSVAVIKCKTTADISPFLPLIIFCPIVSRVESDLDYAVQNLKDIPKTSTAILVVHSERVEHLPPISTSSRVHKRYDEFGALIDFACNESGMLKCDMNKKADKELDSFIKTIKVKQKVDSTTKEQRQEKTAEKPKAIQFYQEPDLPHDIQQYTVKYFEKFKLNKETCLTEFNRNVPWIIVSKENSSIETMFWENADKRSNPKLLLVVTDEERKNPTCRWSKEKNTLKIMLCSGVEDLDKASVITELSRFKQNVEQFISEGYEMVY